MHRTPEEILSTPRKRGRPSKADVAARQAALQLVANKTDETPSQRVDRIQKRFDIMHRLTNGVITGAISSFIVSGAAGVGKSHTVEGLLSTASDTNKIKYRSVRGAQVTGIQLFKLLYEYSDPNAVVLMDDSDSIYDDELSLNLLKAALESHRERRLTYLSETPLLEKDNIPNTFKYSGSLVFITNKDMQTLSDADSRFGPHMRALMSRTNYLDLKLHHPDDLLAWVTHVCKSYHIPVQLGATHAQESVILDWISTHSANLRELSIRTVERLTSYVLTDPSGWETMAEILLLR